MITFISGVPGAGKTLNTIQLVEKECKGREIYYRGIKELTLPWHEITDDECKKWFDYPAGSVFVFDECQQIWPNIPSNQQSPESVKKLDTHRHGGYDFYIITQKPTMVDFRVRGFVGRHLHFERGYGREGTRQLEWQKIINDPDDYHARLEAQTTRIKFNKEYYKVYKSAEVHTVGKRIPKALYVFIVALVASIGGFAYVFWSVNEDIGNPDPLLVQDQSDVPGTMALSKEFQSTDDKDKPKTTAEYIQYYTPRISDLPQSAPAYDQLTEPKSFPRPQCIYRFKTDICKCYTQQATPLSLTRSACMNIVKYGYFDDTRPDIEPEGSGERAGLPALPDVHPTLPQPASVTTKPHSHVVVIPDSTGYTRESSSNLSDHTFSQPARY